MDDLRVAQVAHPDDAELAQLVGDLKAGNAEFARQWHRARPATYRGARKSIHHHRVGRMVLNGDVFWVPGSDVRLVVYTAEPGSASSARLASLMPDRPG